MWTFADGATKQKGEEDVKDESEEGGKSSECVNHSIAHYSVLTLLHFMHQRVFKYSGITTALRSLSSQNKPLLHTVSEHKYQLCKKEVN
jgi:hypothetical protein